MKRLHNIDRGAARSLIRDGFVPPDVLAQLGSEGRLRLEQTDEVGANRLWLDHGTIFLAFSVHLSNDGDQDQFVDECCCELQWAKHVELVDKSEEEYSRVFIAGGEEFARSSVLNSRILGARIPKCGGSLQGILISKAYGLPTKQQVAPKMTAQLNVVFTNGLEVAAPAMLRVQGLQELRCALPAQQVPASPVGIAAPIIRNRRPLFDVDKEP